MLSDFDKSNISEAQFVRWRELAVEIAPLESFTVNGKVDNFKDYSYRGTSLGHCYGVMVEGKANVLVPDVNLSTYDKESFRIMLQQDGKDYRVLLLLTQLDDIVTQYEAYTAP